MQQLVQESVCGNKQFYKCQVEDGICVNCGKSYGLSLNEGDVVKGTCDECGKSGEIVVNTIYKNGDFVGDCHVCTNAREKNRQLVGDFVGESVWVASNGEMNNTNYYNNLNKLVDRVAELPKEELKVFLRRIHGVIER